MGKRITPLDTSRESRAYYEKRWPLGGVYYEPVSGAPLLFRDQLSGLLANSLGLVVIASGSSGGPAGWNINLLRVGEKARELKIDPAFVAFNGDEPAQSGCLLHHAKDSGERLILPLSGESAAFDAFRNNQWYSVSGFLTATSGSIADLRSPLLNAAYRRAETPLSGFMAG